MAEHFDPKEWTLMYSTVSGLGDFLSSYQSDVRAFRFICERTLRFRKFSESIPLRHFKIGVLSIMSPVYGYPMWGNGSLRRSLHRLEDRSVIKSMSPGNGKTNQYLVNVPDLLNLVHMISPNDAIGVVAKKARALFSHMRWTFNKELVYQEDLVMKLEDAINKAFTASQTAMEKRALKRAKTQNPLWIFGEIREYCKDEEIPCDKKPWDKKTIGQAKWWLSKCYIEGVDPKVRLHEVCDRWDDIRKWLAGHRIHIKPVVSFREYVTWWKRINDFLDGYYDEPEDLDRWWEKPDADPEDKQEFKVEVI